MRFRGALVAVVMLAGSTVIAQPAAAAATRAASWTSNWTKPLATMTVTGNYGAYSLGCPNANRAHDYTWYLPSGRKQHLGLDLAGAAGTSVYSIGDGRVLYRGTGMWGSSWGTVMLIEHFATNGNRFTAVYGHISAGKSPRTGATWVTNDMVRKGEKIGTVANLASSVAPDHFHFGIAPGTKTSVVGSSNSTGTGNCPNQPTGTTNPETYLNARSHSSLSGSIVGYKNTNGSVTSWRVVSVSGTLRRYWIPTTTVYWCLRNKGVVDRGPMPARFLNQLPDRNGYHATC